MLMHTIGYNHVRKHLEIPYFKAGGPGQRINCTKVKPHVQSVLGSACVFHEGFGAD